MVIERLDDRMMGDGTKNLRSDPRLIITDDPSTPIHTAFAKVYTMNPNNKNYWLPASKAPVPVSFYFDKHRSCYRIISYDRNELVINSTLVGQMKFLKTSSTFGLWSDTKLRTIYGMGFHNSAQLDQFAEWFEKVRQAAVILEQKLPLPAPAVSAVSVSYGDAGPNMPMQPIDHQKSICDSSSRKSVQNTARPTNNTSARLAVRNPNTAAEVNYMTAFCSPRPDTVQIIDSSIDLSKRSSTMVSQKSSETRQFSRLNTGIGNPGSELDEQTHQMAKLVLENLQFQRELLKAKQLEADLVCLKTTISNLHESVQQKTVEAENERKEKDCWKNKFNDLENTIQTKDDAIQIKEEIIQNTESELKASEGKSQELKDRVVELEKDIERYKEIENENEDLKERITQLQEELENGDKSWEIVDNICSDFAAKIESLIELQGRLKDSLPST